jgi:alkylated DNA repair dioxygenase AlkB
MRFRKAPPSTNKAGGQIESSAVELPRRSLYVLTGSARAQWQHSIRPIEQTRYSITFRTLKHES